MSDDSVDLSSLAVVIVVVLLCCLVATAISFSLVWSRWGDCALSQTTASLVLVVRLPRRYQYCSNCSNHVGLLPLYGDCEVEVEPRPWVEVVGHNVPHNSNHLPILHQSGTFQRLGMKADQASRSPSLAVLEAEQLQTRPMSSARPLELGPAQSQRNQIISPTSAEVFARRDTARSKLSRMSSRRTLTFKSPLEQGWLAVPRPVSQSGASGSAQTVIRVNTINRQAGLVSHLLSYLQCTEDFSLQEPGSQ